MRSAASLIMGFGGMSKADPLVELWTRDSPVSVATILDDWIVGDSKRGVNRFRLTRVRYIWEIGEGDEGPSTRFFEGHPPGARRLPVLCRLFGKPCVQPRLPTPPEGIGPDVPAVHRHDSLMGAGQSNGRRARQKA